MEEKVIPPDEKDWLELDSLRTEKIIMGSLFFRTRIYTQKDEGTDALSTVEFFGLGIIIKGHAVSVIGKTESYFYLQLSDGCWVKGLDGCEFNISGPEVEIRNRESFMKLTISLKTAYGVRRRIIRKKLESKK